VVRRRRRPSSFKGRRPPLLRTSPLLILPPAAANLQQCQNTTRPKFATLALLRTLIVRQSVTAVSSSLVCLCFASANRRSLLWCCISMYESHVLTTYFLTYYYFHFLSSLPSQTNKIEINQSINNRRQEHTGGPPAGNDANGRQARHGGAAARQYGSGAGARHYHQTAGGAGAVQSQRWGNLVCI